MYSLPSATPGDPALAVEAERLLADAAPVVRGAAVWALGRLAPQRLAALAPEQCAREQDPSTRAEWDAALAGTASL